MILAEQTCSINKLEGPVQVYGFSVGDLENVTFEECGKKCLKNEKCFSFAYNDFSKKCFLKDKKHNATSQIRKKNEIYFSAYLSGSCEKGISSSIYFGIHFSKFS